MRWLPRVGALAPGAPIFISKRIAKRARTPTITYARCITRAYERGMMNRFGGMRLRAFDGLSVDFSATGRAGAPASDSVIRARFTGVMKRPAYSRTIGCAALRRCSLRPFSRRRISAVTAKCQRDGGYAAASRRHRQGRRIPRASLPPRRSAVREDEEEKEE